LETAPFFQILPHLNATLNFSATALLVTGYWNIRHGNRRIHQICMVSAFFVSLLFLVSYLVYHAQVGSVRFEGEGLIRTLYLVILSAHTILASTVPILAIITLRRALRGRFDRHKKIARWTLPIWLMVNITGIVVYVFVYHLNG